MNIAALKAMPSLDSIMSDIERYGIAQNAVELMTYGFTVVSPANPGGHRRVGRATATRPWLP